MAQISINCLKPFWRFVEKVKESFVSDGGTGHRLPLVAESERFDPGISVLPDSSTS